MQRYFDTELLVRVDQRDLLYLRCHMQRIYEDSLQWLRIRSVYLCLNASLCQRISL